MFNDVVKFGKLYLGTILERSERVRVLLEIDWIVPTHWP